MQVDRATIPEVVFVTYDGVVKDYRPFLLKQIASNPKMLEVYKNYIDTALITTLTDKQLNFLPVISTSRNILEYISIKKFNYDKSLNDLYQMFPNIYSDSELLPLGNSINILRRQKFTSKIFIYTEEYDKRIHFDIQDNFSDMSTIEYISGPFEDVINSITETITTYILNDIKLVDKLIELNRIKETQVLISDTGYNYKDNNGELIVNIDNLEEKMYNHIFKLAMFKPVSNFEVIPPDIMDDSYYGD